MGLEVPPGFYALNFDGIIRANRGVVEGATYEGHPEKKPEPEPSYAIANIVHGLILGSQIGQTSLIGMPLQIKDA